MFKLGFVHVVFDIGLEILQINFKNIASISYLKNLVGIERQPVFELDFSWHWRVITIAKGVVK